MSLTTSNANTATQPVSVLGDIAAREPTIARLAVRGLVEIVEQMGGPRQLFLREIGWDVDQLHHNDARVPFPEVCRICEAAMDLTGDCALGLRWAELLKPRTFVPVSHMLAHVQTLRNAFELLSKFEKLFSDRPFFALLEDADRAIVQTHDWLAASPRMRSFSAEVILAGIWKMVHSVCPQAQLQGLNLAYPAPSYHADYQRVFETTVRFEQSFSGLILDRAALDAPAPHADNDVYTALETVAERRLQRVTQHTPYTFRVRELMRGQVPERVSMVAAARSLGLSVRSLRRQLAAEGTSFRQLEYAAFESVSKWLLRDRKRTIQGVAHELGFSDVTTFHRAFKRWTGLTPGEFRERDADR